MSGFGNTTLVILTWDKCSHCLKFKNQKNNSGMSNMEELIHKSNIVMPDLRIITANITGDVDPPNVPSAFNDIDGKWFPSIYLFPTEEFNSNNMINGKIMGGTILNNTAKQDGSRISMTSDFIISWIRNTIPSGISNTTHVNVNTDKQYEKLPRYMDYVSRLNKIK